MHTHTYAPDFCHQMSPNSSLIFTIELTRTLWSLSHRFNPSAFSKCGGRAFDIEVDVFDELNARMIGEINALGERISDVNESLMKVQKFSQSKGGWVGLEHVLQSLSHSIDELFSKASNLSILVYIFYMMPCTYFLTFSTQKQVRAMYIANAITDQEEHLQQLELLVKDPLCRDLCTFPFPLCVCLHRTLRFLFR